MATLNIVCEWKNCAYASQESYDFNNHVKNHIPGLGIVKVEEGEEAYECLWLNCLFQTKEADEVVWHVKYHSFHAILKAQGDVLTRTRNLPPCTLSTAESNTVPNRSPPLCKWDSCNEVSTGQIEFIKHVNFCHILFLKTRPNTRLKCLWSGCNFNATKKSKLAEHVKIHTGDKAAACSHCGQSFANSAKFVNHRHRQLPINEQSPQCSHCLAYLPNEKLLRMHMRQHVNHYKCCFCELTCCTPAILNVHIKYRHLDYKPFKCSSCPHVCKSQSDLNRHMLTHSNDYFTCTQEGCTKKYRTQFSLAKHFEREHTQNPQLKNFACHLCTKTFDRGTLLTTHLCSFHKVNKPSGYSRFEYRQEQDGYFRLQTTRLESLEVEEMEVVFVDSEEKLGEECTEEDVDDPLSLENTKVSDVNDIPLTVDVIDEEGKIISSNLVTTKVALPPEAKVVAVGK